ncbi:MAG: hypothetical protein DHS20C15_20370 [Planctomycetota bacterium]|nr:MAG: hypothetical protein DHS20C15_20370 [Planctomycetota bacterium]
MWVSRRRECGFGLVALISHLGGSLLLGVALASAISGWGNRESSAGSAAIAAVAIHDGPAAGPHVGNGGDSAPGDPNDCLKNSLLAQAGCKAIHCEPIVYFWIRFGISCSEPAYTQCLSQVAEVFNLCLKQSGG